MSEFSLEDAPTAEAELPDDRKFYVVSSRQIIYCSQAKISLQSYRDVFGTLAFHGLNKSKSA